MDENRYLAQFWHADKLYWSTDCAWDDKAKAQDYVHHCCITLRDNGRVIDAQEKTQVYYVDCRVVPLS